MQQILATHYIEWIMQQEWWRFVKVSIKNTIVMHTAIWFIIQVIHTKSEYITNECKIFNSSVQLIQATTQLQYTRPAVSTTATLFAYSLNPFC